MSPNTPAERRMQAMALPALPEPDAAAINRFLDAIWAEHGLARQTLDSYRRDLEGFARWRAGAGGGIGAADRAALFDYLAWRSRHGYSPRSNARLLSAFRAFFAQQVRNGARGDDPTRYWIRPNCLARCPRPWVSTRSRLCSPRPTSPRRWACATGPCSN